MVGLLGRSHNLQQNLETLEKALFCKVMMKIINFVDFLHHLGYWNEYSK